MQQVNQAQHGRGNERHSYKAMGDPAMMLQPCDGAFDSPKNVDVSRLCRQHHGYGRERSFAIESGTRQARAGQKMGDGIQIEILNNRSGFKLGKL